MAEEQAAEKRLSIGKIYMKDFSFESPQSPDVFRNNDKSGTVRQSAERPSSNLGYCCC